MCRPSLLPNSGWECLIHLSERSVVTPAAVPLLDPLATGKSGATLTRCSCSLSRNGGRSRFLEAECTVACRRPPSHNTFTCSFQGLHARHVSRRSDGQRNRALKHLTFDCLIIASRLP